MERRTRFLIPPWNYEGDWIPFPLEGIPPDLHTLIMEKMIYTDFAHFNGCNTFSSRMCQSLPTNVKLLFPMEKAYNLSPGLIHFFDRNSYFKNYYLPQEFEFTCLPQNVHFICDKFELNLDEWAILKHHKFTAETLFIQDAEVCSSVFKEILQVMKPRKLKCNRLENDVLSFPEMRMIKSLQFIIDNVSEEELQGLLMPDLTISGSAISLPSLTKFFQQWARGERFIWNVSLGIRPSLTIHQLVAELRQIRPISIHSVGDSECWISKTENHRRLMRIRPISIHSVGDSGCWISKTVNHRGVKITISGSELILREDVPLMEIKI